jgi:hypothetical protein
MSQQNLIGTGRVPQVRPGVPGPKLIFFDCFSWLNRDLLIDVAKTLVGLPPYFLWSLVALSSLMRLSLLKATHVDLGE